ncbi:MAG: DUF4388 domain-containing protein [Anaerolineales bacterium]|nr:MAG: DUF4388 domain-containing protein [Anaerolineales bacterium]
MAVKGNLKDMSLASLISVNCNEMNQASLLLYREDKEGSIFLTDGNVVHAVLDSFIGKEAVYEMLTWEDGEFELKKNVEPPERTITAGWSSLLLEGMHRIDENAAELEDLNGLEKQNEKKEKTEMAAKRSEALADTLSEMLASSTDIEGAVVVSSDGLVIGSQLPKGLDESRMGASAAALFGLSKRTTPELGRGNFTQNLIQGKEGNIIIVSIGENAVFIGLTSTDVNLGMVFLEAREAAEKIATVL